MDEAPAKGVNINLSYGSYYNQKIIADTLVERHKTGQSLTDGFMEEAEKEGKRRLEEVAYALYLSDYEATHPSLGRPLETWDELCEDEREMYLRHVNTVLKKQEQMYGHTVRKMEEANLLPFMEQRAKERESEREASLRRAIDWREND